MGGTGGYQVDGNDQAQFSNLINELIRMNYHQIANQPASSAKNGQQIPGTKGRANSEKTGTTSSNTHNNNVGGNPNQKGGHQQPTGGSGNNSSSV